MSEFLADAAERIIVLGIIFRRVMQRFRKFLVWLGMPSSAILEVKPQKICAIISEFGLEYRTCRERVLQQIQKKTNHRERNKTRGKMITEMEKFKARPKTHEEEADSNLKQLLAHSEESDANAIRGKNSWKRTREGKDRRRLEESLAEMVLNAEGDVDDALLDSLVKTATQSAKMRSNPRERRRSKHSDRKSSKRSRTRERTLINELEALQANQEPQN